MRSLAAALCLVSVCCPSRAEAQEYTTTQPQRTSRARVILVQPNADSTDLAEAPTRIRAELEAAGFEVEIVAGDATLGPREQLERVEQQRVEQQRAGQHSVAGPAPVATIVLAAAGTGADIWIADRVTSKTSVRRIDIKASAQGASILAVRTVELLRASLLETQQRAQLEETTKSQTQASPAPSEAPDEFGDDFPPSEAESPADLVAALDLGLLGLWGLSGIRPQIGPSLRVSVGTRTIKGRFTLAAPILGERLERAQGTARVQPLLGQLDVIASFPVQKNTRLYGSLGFGGYLLRARGEADAPAIGHDETATGIAFQMGMGLQVQTSRRLNLFIEPQLIWMLPEVVIRIADREAGRLGQPAIGSTIGLTWTF
jgi:hypothetical protein